LVITRKGGKVVTIPLAPAHRPRHPGRRSGSRWRPDRRDLGTWAKRLPDVAAGSDREPPICAYADLVPITTGPAHI